MRSTLLHVFLQLASIWHSCQAFTAVNHPSSGGRAVHVYASTGSSSGRSEQQQQQQEQQQQQSVTIESVLQDNYPEFYSLLSKNDLIFEQLQEAYADSGYTIFAPNSAAFEALEDKKRQQLDDPRNLETAQKMGLYHIVAAEALSLTQLNREDWTVPKTPEGLPALKFSAIVTLGGEVPIGRFKKKADNGNFFSNLLGGEDKDVALDDKGKPITEIIVGPEAKILRSLKLGNAVVHEVDSLVSPYVLWRYCDQLRIPGF